MISIPSTIVEIKKKILSQLHFKDNVLPKNLHSLNYIHT
jgi:hypothetical protein